MGTAAALSAEVKLGFRYQYLSGGVNTGSGWSGWAGGSGHFVTSYISESLASGLIPVFSYYQLLQSRPGSLLAGGEGTRDRINLNDASTMRLYFQDLRLFLEVARASGAPLVVLHLEPDLWGYMEAQAAHDDGHEIAVHVASTGLSELRGFADNLAGFAQAIVALRDRYAPNVLLAYHLSSFGTGKDIRLSHPNDAEVEKMAKQSARFFSSLGAHFDLVFTDFANADSGYRQVVDHDHGASWWRPQDFAHEARYLRAFVQRTGRRVVVWQIPVGNTLMRAEDNTTGHYQDNRVQWLLGTGAGRGHLQEYVDAGVIGLLFGPALPGATCACDGQRDGVTNPPPIDGNDLVSLSADDDGGYLVARARAYERGGMLTLPQG